MPTSTTQNSRRCSRRRPSAPRPAAAVGLIASWLAIRQGRDGWAFIFSSLTVLLAVTTLFVGLFALFRGGDFGRSYSNKLMRLRVALQAVAIVILVLAVWWRAKSGG